MKARAAGCLALLAVAACASTARPAHRRPDRPTTASLLWLGGEVLDHDGHPVAGATVTLDRSVAISGADGSFMFEHLAPGAHAVSAEKAELYGEAEAPADQGTEPLRIYVHRGPTLVLRVIDAFSAPIAGAHARILTAAATTDADGVARLRSIDDRFELVWITAPRHAPVTLIVQPGDEVATVERSVTLDRGAAVEGIVVGPDGKPVANATVEVTAAGKTWEEAVHSDASGAWHVDSLGAGRHVVHASSARFAAMPDLVFEHDGLHPKTGLVVHVDSGGEIVGTVVDTAGAPVAGARVSWASSGATTDSRGQFRAIGIADGDYTMSAKSAMQASQPSVVTVRRGARVELQLVLTGGHLAGTVVDVHGTPVVAAVSAEGKDKTRIDSTDEHGHFDFGPVPAGDYEIAALRNGDAEPTSPVTVPAGSRDVTLVVPDASTITGRVVVDGKPIAYYGLVVTHVPNDRVKIVRAADGRFTRSNVGPGAWSVVILAPGFARLIVGVEVAAGSAVDLGDLVLDRGRSIHGRVTDETGKPVRDATVTITASQGYDAPTSSAPSSRATCPRRPARTDAIASTASPSGASRSRRAIRTWASPRIASWAPVRTRSTS